MGDALEQTFPSLKRCIIEFHALLPDSETIEAEINCTKGIPRLPGRAQVQDINNDVRTQRMKEKGLQEHTGFMENDNGHAFQVSTITLSIMES